MARAYSDDLRQKLLEAHDRGLGSLAELAGRFGVSCAWAWKVSAARKRSGQVARRRHRPGPKSQVNETLLARLLDDNRDLTLRQLQAEMEKYSGLWISTQHLWRVLRRLGFRLKKSHSTPRSGIRKKTASGGKSTWKRSAPSRQRG